MRLSTHLVGYLLTRDFILLLREKQSPPANQDENSLQTDEIPSAARDEWAIPSLHSRLHRWILIRGVGVCSSMRDRRVLCQIEDVGSTDLSLQPRDQIFRIYKMGTSQSGNEITRVI
jgi:hypothetical protein